MEVPDFDVKVFRLVEIMTFRFVNTQHARSHCAQERESVCVCSVVFSVDMCLQSSYSNKC